MATKTLKLSWCADLRLENELRRMAISFDIQTIPFSKIDLRESQVNGARMGESLLSQKIDDYMQGFRNGDTFPRPAMHKTPTGYVILSGNQRCESIRRLISEGDLPKDLVIEAYILGTTDKYLLEIVARAANVAHGAGAEKAERLFHALHCVKSLGMRVQDAAVAFMVSRSAIEGHVRAEDSRKKLAESGIDAAGIPNSVIEPLVKLNYDANAQTKLGSLVVQHSPPAERVRQVVATIQKETSAPARISRIKEFEKELVTAAHSIATHRNGHTNGVSKVPLRPRRDKFFHLLSRLVNFLESENAGDAFSSLEELQVASDADRKAVLDLCKKLQYRLKVIVK